MDRLEIGKIINTHGLRGEVKVVSWTDSPEDFERIKTAYIMAKESDIKVTVKSIKYQKSNLIVKFAGFDKIEDVEMYKGCVLTAERDELPPLPEGVHYIVDLIGCTVKGDDGEVIGTLEDVFTAGGGDVYDVSRQGKSNLLIPTAGGVVQSIDISSKTVVVKLPEGLED